MGMFMLKPSFAGGELTPSLYGRTDLQKYDVGAAVIENAIVLRYGGVARRPGFRAIDYTVLRRPSRLIPFSYNIEQNYILEFSDETVRVFKAGDNDIPDSERGLASFHVPYGIDYISEIKTTQSADTLFLVHPYFPPATIKRYSENDWRYEAMDFTVPPFNDPSFVFCWVEAVTGSTILRAEVDSFSPYDVGRFVRLGHNAQSEYIRTVPNATGDNMVVRVMPGASVYVETFGFWKGTIHVDKLDSNGVWVRQKSQSGNHTQNYNMTFTNEDDSIRYYRVISDDFDRTLWENENPNQQGEVSIQAFGKDYFGIGKITGYIDARAVNIDVIREFASTERTKDSAVSVWGGLDGYPSAVAFFEDRLVFGGSPKHPQTYWASKTGDYWNFDQSIPTVDDDAIIGTLSTGQMNGIKAIIPFSEMLIMTSGGEYRVGGSNGQAFTPTNQRAQVQEYRGVNDLMPVIIGGRIIYVQQHGTIVRDLEYAYDVDKFTGSDVSILAEHLFRNHKIVSMTYQQVPDSIVWFVRDDGVLLGLTYIKEQDVFAWHHHTTNGKFIDVCAVPGKDYDELWAVVERDTFYAIERMDNRDTPVTTDRQFFVDCGVTFDFGDNPQDHLENITWLAGREVSILADGHEGTLTVSPQGYVNLNGKYHVVTIGLKYKTQIVTLPIEPQAPDGSYASRKKRIEKMTLQFRETLGGKYGLYGKELDRIKWRSIEDYDAPDTIFTGKKEVHLPHSSYNETLQISIESDQPFPMTVLSIIPEVLPGG